MNKLALIIGFSTCIVVLTLGPDSAREHSLQNLEASGIFLQGVYPAIETVEYFAATNSNLLTVFVNATDSATQNVRTDEKIKDHEDKKILDLEYLYIPLVTTLAECLDPPSGLTSWWPGDGNAHDIVGGVNGDFWGEATNGPGLINMAFALDGDGDFINIKSDQAINFGEDDFTIDLWVNFADTAGEQVLIEKWIQGVPYIDGWTLTKLENNVLRFATDNGDGTEAHLDSVTLTLVPGTWYQFAVTRHGPEITLFMNGVPIAQDPGLVTSNLDSGSSLKLGHRGNPDDTPGSIDWRGFYLNGLIDEVELFVGTALTEDQIGTLFRAQSGKCKD